MENKKIDFIDRIGEAKRKNNTLLQLLKVLTTNYFQVKPTTRDGMILFASQYEDVDELLTAIMEYSISLKDRLEELYNIVENNIKGDFDNGNN